MKSISSVHVLLIFFLLLKHGRLVDTWVNKGLLSLSIDSFITVSDYTALTNLRYRLEREARVMKDENGASE